MSNRGLKQGDRSRAWGFVALVPGLFILMISAGLIPASEDSIHVPRTILGLCGLVFVAGGVSLLFRDSRFGSPLAAAVILGCFASVGIWVGLYSDPSQIQGGIPFLPQDMNGKIGKAVFLGGGIALRSDGRAAFARTLGFEKATNLACYPFAMHRDFTYDVTKDGRVRISWNGKPVVTLKGNKAAKFLAQCQGKTGDDLQLVLCRFTGNFKRGNERRGV